MSDAIELLKEILEDKKDGNEILFCINRETEYSFLEIVNCLDEALLALEQKEKLKEWIEKRELFLNKKKEQYLKNKEPFKSRKVRDIKISKILLKEIKELEK